MFIPPAAFPSCGVSELLAACVGVLPGVPPSPGSHVFFSSPAGCERDRPRGEKLMVTAKAELFSRDGAGVGMAPAGQSPGGLHGKRDPMSALTLIWLMSSTLSDNPCAWPRPLLGDDSSCSASLQQELKSELGETGRLHRARWRHPTPR